MNRILDIIKKFDIFGRPLHFNFDKQWNTHDTRIGGFFTCLMLFFTLIYTGLLFSIMVNYSQNTTRTMVNELDLSQLGNITLNETDILFFSWIYGKMVDPSKPIEEVFKYADIYFEEQTFNFSTFLSSTTRRVPVKWCT